MMESDHKFANQSLLRFKPWLSVHAYQEESHWIWCPSVIQAEDGTWRMFASRWPKSVPFHPCWLTNSEIVVAASGHIQGPYFYQQTILPPRGSQWWDGRMTHNSRVLRHPEGYALFYTGVTHPLPDVVPGENPPMSDPRVIAARAGKRIGVAFAERLDGPWRRMDQPLLETHPETFYSYLTSNAAPCLEPDGSVLLIFKGRSHEGNLHGPMTLGAARAKSIEGPYEVMGPLQFETESSYILEDPFCWKIGDQYHLLAKDITGSLCGEEQAGIHATSHDGLHWKLGQPPRGYSRDVPLSDGTTQRFGSLERVSLVFQDGHPTHLTAAMSNGPEGFHTATRTWGGVIALY